MSSRILLGLLLLWLLPLGVQAEPWRSYKHKDGIHVEYRRLQSSLLEIRAQVRVQSLNGAFLHLLNDTAAISQWVENAERVELLGSPEPHSNIVHTYFHAVWPVSSRDMVTQSVWTQASDGSIQLQVSDLGQQYPAVKGYVRMREVQSRWTLTPDAEGGLLIQYQGQADPAGNLPHFIVNRVALKAMFNTFANLVRVLPQYQRPYPGVTELSSQPKAD